MDAAELGDRIVAVVEEDPFVELLGAFETHRGIDRLVAADVEVADELVEEQPTERLRAAAVASEQRALDDLGQVHEGEHRAVEVREIPAQYVALFRGEGFGDVHSHGATSYGGVPAGPAIARAADLHRCGLRGDAQCRITAASGSTLIDSERVGKAAPPSIDTTCPRGNSQLASRQGPNRDAGVRDVRAVPEPAADREPVAPRQACPPRRPPPVRRSDGRVVRRPSRRGTRRSSRRSPAPATTRPGATTT